jgi:16S rRNA (adenine1518-N6/adenine1519-N6)-dimethyltransferase
MIKELNLSFYNMQGKSDLGKLVVDRINALGITPDKNLGQHFLVDQEALNTLVNSLVAGAVVIEIGAGVGQLTEALAEKAGRVISIEIDRRYEPILTQIEKHHPNVQIIYNDALLLDFSLLVGESGRRQPSQIVQIIASLPYHITEPFLHKITEFPMHNATLIVGKSLAEAIKVEDEENQAFGQLTLLVHAFFESEVLKMVGKRGFFPVPRTDSAIIRLTPKTENRIKSDRRIFVLRRLFRTARRSPLVKNCLKEGLIEFAQLKGERLTQNQARAIVSQMGIPNEVLSKPFQQLSNDYLRILSRALRQC